MKEIGVENRREREKGRKKIEKNKKNKEVEKSNKETSQLPPIAERGGACQSVREFSSSADQVCTSVVFFFLRMGVIAASLPTPL